MRSKRTLLSRLAALGGALALAAATLAAVGAAAAPTPASAASITENFAGYVALFDLYSPISIGYNITQPSIVQPGGTFKIVFGGSNQVIPTTQSGFNINYLNGLQNIVPVPSGATFKTGSLSTGLQWTYVNKGVTTHGTYEVTYCTKAGSSCNATPYQAGAYLGKIQYPYIETSTGPAHFAGGGSLTLPGWSAGFTATGSYGGTIQTTVSEFDTDTNLAGLGAVDVTSYPSAVFGGTPRPPPYVYQALASTAIGAPVPVISAVLPNSGPVGGGNTVTIHGLNLSNATKVTFGGRKSTVFSNLTADAITAVVPAGVAGETANVRVTNSLGTSGVVAADQYTWTHRPIVTRISPKTGPPTGGTSVTITGSQLSGATAVDFGFKKASSFTVNSSHSITAIAPAGSKVVDVTVTSPHGTSIVSQLDRFNYRTGYLLTAADGGIFAYGHTPFEGSAGATPLNKPVVGMASTPDAGGYWLVASDGGIFSYGDAGFFGSAGGMTLDEPVVGMAATPDGFGYWLVASDGGVFSYGDAPFYGSTGGTTLNAPIVGMASTPDGRGYWLVASDGGVFSYGDASFYGSMGGTHLNQPIVGMASTPDGKGYWLVASDGGIFSFGDASFYGSAGSLTLNKPVVGMAADPNGGGYWLVASDGGIFTYGDIPFYGSAGSLVLNQPVVGATAG